MKNINKLKADKTTISFSIIALQQVAIIQLIILVVIQFTNIDVAFSANNKSNKISAQNRYSCSSENLKILKEQVLPELNKTMKSSGRRGQASVYGVTRGSKWDKLLVGTNTDRFAGKRTKSGIPMDPNKYTAAVDDGRGQPAMGSILWAEYNGIKKLFVVTDTGPLKKNGRALDLSPILYVGLKYETDKTLKYGKVKMPKWISKNTQNQINNKNKPNPQENKTREIQEKIACITLINEKYLTSESKIHLAYEAEIRKFSTHNNIQGSK